METKMDSKRQVLQALKDEFDQWLDLLSGLSDEQIHEIDRPSALSIKDQVAHLWAWQQRSIAHMEAARDNQTPVFPGWPSSLDPESEQDLDRVNAWIFETNRDKSWSQVYSDWQAGFRRFMELGQAVPEDDLLEAGKYAWLDGEPLAIVLTASCEHHHEHLEGFSWLRRPASLDG